MTTALGSPHAPITTLKQLETALDAAGQATAKDLRLYGKKDAATGEITLYVSTKRAGNLDRLSGKAAERRELAREKLSQLVDAHTQALLTRTYADTSGARALTEDGLKGVKRLHQAITTRLAGVREDHAVRASEVRGYAAFFKEMPRVGAAPAPAPAPVVGPTLAETGLTPGGRAVTKAAADLVAAMAGGTGTEAAVGALGDRLAELFKDRHASRSDRTAFALSPATTLKAELGRELRAALSAADPGGTCAALDVEALAAAAVNRAASRLLPDREVAGPPVRLTYQREGNTVQVDLPKIRIGTKEFSPTGYLGVGGFGTAYRYEAADGSKIALKLPPDGRDETIAGVAEEVRGHSGAVGDGHKRVLGLEGVVRLADGRVGIALEFAPHGDVFEMAKTLAARIDAGANGVASGRITAAEADLIRLTLLQDMARGLRHIHDSQDMTHLDFKAPNCFIGAGGIAKVADFGTTREGDPGPLSGLPKNIENPRFMAPELADLAQERSAINQTRKEGVAAEKGAVKARLMELFPTASAKDITGLTSNIVAPREAALRAREQADIAQLDDRPLSRKIDVWGLGIAAVNLFSGRELAPDVSFDSEVEPMVAEFGRDRGNVALGRPDPSGALPPGALAAETGLPAVDRLINRLLKPDPRDRPSLTSVLASSAFRTPGIGSPEVRGLIVALASGDDAAIDAARQKLAGQTV